MGCGRLPLAAVGELTSEVIGQGVFHFLFTGFLKGLLPTSILGNSATNGLRDRRSAAS